MLRAYFQIITKNEGSNVTLGYLYALRSDKWIIDVCESDVDADNKILKKLQSEYIAKYPPTIQMELKMNGSYHIDTYDPPFLLDYEYVPIYDNSNDLCGDPDFDF
jgi:hypothetical protein